MLLVSIARGILSLLLFTLTTLVIGVPLISLSLFKLVAYRSTYRPLLTRWLDKIASAWMVVNNAHQCWLLPTRIHYEGPEQFTPRQWFMLVVNHQSWVDILVLLRLFTRRVPYFKFFLKTSLIWIPVLGLAFWALDFPFMRRHSKAQIARDPSLAGKDLATTQKQCERYSAKPVTIISYLEGTRFTPTKHREQASPYQHLLIPKAGGLAFTLTAMNGRINTLLDVTIHYPAGRPNFWQYLSGQVEHINVVAQERSIEANLLGDYANDEQYRRRFQAWVNALWQEKDALLERLSRNENRNSL
ncbi:acyltransferase [Gilvimarinus sp. 2_MG-2023]|uniref:acyltransferase n=1 Tax=Gilvimarinus sp. 2_MG-2023 TaxID=3062666 RepID=UPI0026E2A6AB|nr:acyltransferase [Gilvimarinus sp. 2_MG-2023]MDO6570678.1 acyltransferase [Gilvimarinus sp. 2_MG-2023]